MKNTSELRQGSYILQSHLKTIDVVVGIKPGYILTDRNVDDADWVGDLLYEPIPLTEDWLLKFGFSVKNNVNSAKEYSLNKGTKQDFLIEIDNDNEIWRVIQSDSGIYDYYYDVQLFHVHQLQNLVHALNGEELTIKEPAV